MKPLSRFSFLTSIALWAATVFTVPTFAEQPEITATYGDGSNPFLLATGSPGELGLLDSLAGAFARQTPATLKWVKAGSGESLDLLKDRQVDVILVHAPAAEKKASQEGWATGRMLVGSNEFYIVGPKDDPAKIKDATAAADAYRRIAVAGANFITRADDSGTHKKEMQIWKAAKPSNLKGDWYIATRDFMAASLKRANEVNGYFMTDSSTWVAERAKMPNLTVLFRGDKVRSTPTTPCCPPRGQPSNRDCRPVRQLPGFRARATSHPRLRQGPLW